MGCFVALAFLSVDDDVDEYDQLVDNDIPQSIVSYLTIIIQDHLDEEDKVGDALNLHFH